MYVSFLFEHGYFYIRIFHFASIELYYVRNHKASDGYIVLLRISDLSNF